MNQMMVVIAIAIAGISINFGLASNSKMGDIDKQKEALTFQNISMFNEIKQKQILRKSEPETMSHAFTLFINQSKMFEIYSGTRMELVFGGIKENENMEDHYTQTEFRNVKGLELTINVQKFSNETDMLGVLNDIYLLEKHTDFKVSEISTGNNGLIVKGELYGI